MKFYITPEIELRRVAALSIMTASGDADEWETDIIDDADADYYTSDEA